MARMVTALLFVALCPSSALRESDAALGELQADQSPTPCPECTCAPTSAPISAPTPRPTEEPASATDDPHIRNLAQESFTINQPGEYVFLRVPLDPAQAAELEVRGTIAATKSACKMYTTMVSASGSWLGDKEVHVRPLRRSEFGANDVGQELWPFSLMISEKGAGPAPSAAEGSWRSFEGMRTEGQPSDNYGLPGSFHIAAVHDEAFGLMNEGNTFQFQVGHGSNFTQRARINVAQASHQALNVAMSQVRRLGARRLGGLLGTERHDVEVEALTTDCKLEKSSDRTMAQGLNLVELETSEVRPSVLYSWWH